MFLFKFKILKMKLIKFWNKAIEHYCTNNRKDTDEIFETVFIAISEESLEKIKINYIQCGKLTPLEIELSEKNIENSGGIIDSYYTAIKEVHNNLNHPEKYSFLRFSVLVVGAFKQDDSPLRNFWKDFDPFILNKGISTINNRTEYLNRLILNLSKWCYIKYKKT